MIGTFVIGIPILAYSQFPQTLGDVVSIILFFLVLGAIFYVSWPTKAGREKWLQKHWRERIALIWVVPLGIAILLFIIYPIGVIAAFSFYTAIDTFF